MGQQWCRNQRRSDPLNRHRRPVTIASRALTAAAVLQEPTGQRAVCRPTRQLSVHATVPTARTASAARASVVYRRSSSSMVLLRPAWECRIAPAPGLLRIAQGLVSGVVRPGNRRGVGTGHPKSAARAPTIVVQGRRAAPQRLGRRFGARRALRRRRNSRLADAGQTHDNITRMAWWVRTDSNRGPAD